MLARAVLLVARLPGLTDDERAAIVERIERDHASGGPARPPG